MSDAADQALGDAALVAALLAVDPVGLGGAVLRGRAVRYREAWIGHLHGLCGQEVPLRRVPLAITDDRLLGGLDLAATLRSGQPVRQKGLLEEADGGFLILPGAERLAPSSAARIVSAMDRAMDQATCGSGTQAAWQQSRFGVIALDEGDEQDERTPDALSDRLAFHITLDALDPRCDPQSAFSRDALARARARCDRIAFAADLIDAFCRAGETFGVASLRAPLFALRAARALAALGGRAMVSDADAAIAARLVFAHRATRAPTPQEAEPPEPETAQDESDERHEPETPQDLDRQDADQPDLDENTAPAGPMMDIVAEAVAAALPDGLLAQLKTAGPRPGGAGEHGRGAMAGKSLQRGRMIGVRRGDLRRGARLALIPTLLAAAPWQRLRQAGRPAGVATERLSIRREDFRIKRFKHRTRTTTVFVVDASGSSALHRLAEAKGAVELLLAGCYVRRDEVALIAFRGRDASILLEPTRSLTRAKRSLAQLPGGGGTPLAAGLTAAADLTRMITRRQSAPLLVLLTDGQANVAISGASSRAEAERDALAAAALLRAQGLASLLIDTSPRPQPRARTLAETMAARYLHLPTSDAGRLSQAIRAQAPRR